MTDADNKNIFSIIDSFKINGQTLTDLTSKIVTKDGKIFFTIYTTKESYNEAQDVAAKCKKQLLKLDGITNVNITFANREVTGGDKKEDNAKDRMTISAVKKTLIIASGKGGVGKTSVTVEIAFALSSLGYKVAIVDADVYGPSVSAIFPGKIKLKKDLAIPNVVSNVKIMSTGYMVQDASSLVWRGPMASKMLHQLLTKTDWAYDGEEVDIMLIDTPPGTGDVHLTILSNYHVDGVIIVSTPHMLSVADTKRSIDMYAKFNVNILGVIENMSYFRCTETDKVYYIFGKEKGKKMAYQMGIPYLGEIPIIEAGKSRDGFSKKFFSTGHGYAGTTSSLGKIARRIKNALYTDI